jgi:hypothetical protein
MVQNCHDTSLACCLIFVSNVHPHFHRLGLGFLLPLPTQPYSAQRYLVIQCFILSPSHKGFYSQLVHLESCIQSNSMTLKPYPPSIKYKPSLNLASSCQIPVPTSMCHPSAISLGLPTLCH